MRNREYGIALNWSYVGISVVIFTILTLLIIYMPNISNFDGKVLHSVRLALSPYPSYIPAFISEFGRANWMLWPQITAGCVLVSHRKYLHAFLLIFFTHASFLLTDWVKTLVCRERPCVYPGYSFPSGHSSTSMCFYGILIYLVLYYVRPGFWRYFLTTLFGIWIFMVGISRLWLGVHYPIDVVAGMFLGFMLVNLFIIVSKFFSR